MTTTALTLLIVGCSLCFGITAESDADAWNHPVTYDLGELADDYSFVVDSGFGNINLLTGIDERIASHTPEGHYLAGWIDNKEGKTWDTGAEYRLHEDGMVFTAVWAAGQSWVYIKIYSDAPGLTVSDGSRETSKNELWTYGTELTVKATTKEGYTSRIYLNGSDITSKGKFKVGESNKLTSKYVLNDYEVTFDSNLIVKKDGTAISSGDMVAYGKELTVELTSEAVPETGHELRIYWNSTDITTEKKFTVGVTNVLSVDNVPIEYAVTFDSNLIVKENGTKISSGDPVAYGTKLTVEAIAMEGHTSKIYLNTDTVVKDGEFTVGLDNDLTVEYTPINYEVTFDSNLIVKENGTEISSGDPVAYGTVLTVEAIAMEGHTSKIYLNIHTEVTDGEFTVGLDNDLTVEYTPIKYKVTFDSNLTVMKDGTAISSGEKVAYGKELTVEAAEEEGHSPKIYLNIHTEVTDGKFTVRQENALSVTYTAIEYAVTFDEGLTVKKNDGDAISSGDMVAYGTMLTVEAAEKTGHIPDISLNGVALTGTAFAVGLRNALTVTYAPIEYTVKIAVQGEGSVDQDELKIPYGTAASVEGNVLTIGDRIIIATPSDRNHRFTAWSGVPATVTSDVTITASFSQTPIDGKAEDELDADDYYPAVPTSPARTPYDADSTKTLVACAAAAVAAALAAMFLLVDSRRR